MPKFSSSRLVARARLARASGNRGRLGLTLVEIMVVIAILGVLMTVVAVNVVSSLQDGYVDTTKLQIKKVEGSLQMYAAKHRGKYPTTSEGLQAASKHFEGNRIPTDSWGNEFQYFSPGTHGDHPYEIISLGRDGADGGEDYDADIKSWEIGDLSE